MKVNYISTLRSTPLARIQPLTINTKKKEKTVEQKLAKFKKLVGGYKLKDVSPDKMNRDYDKVFENKALINIREIFTPAHERFHGRGK